MCATGGVDFDGEIRPARQSEGSLGQGVEGRNTSWPTSGTLVEQVPDLKRRPDLGSRFFWLRPSRCTTELGSQNQEDFRINDLST